MRFPVLARPRTVWVPTLLGWGLLFCFFTVPAFIWLWRGETLLSADSAAPPEVLIVDGWIKDEPIAVACGIFRQQGFQLAVAAGGYDGAKWARRRWSNAEIARQCFQKGGVPPDKILLAQAPDAEVQRTYSVAVATKEALDRQGLKPKAITVFTRGAHALRSRMVYQKVFGPKIQVGVISWKPPGTESEPWWRNSSRAEEFIKETVGCFWEWAFNSGRGV